MANRMDKYKEPRRTRDKTRTNKNKNLYNNFYKNTIYTEFTDINVGSIVKEDVKDKHTRESFQNTKEFRNLLGEIEEHKKSTENISPFFKTADNKVYDINSILETAKKNREEKDELEIKRKLRNSDYNIFENNNDLENIKEKRMRDVISDDEEEELKELIHTITTKPISEEDDDLLNLLPKSLDETIISDDIAITLIKEEQEIAEDEDMDNSFYTRSMELKKEDLEEDDEEFKEEVNSKSFLKTFIIIIFITLILIGIYFLYKKFIG